MNRLVLECGMTKKSTGWWRSKKQWGWMLAYALGAAVLCVEAASAANQYPQQDLPSVTSGKDLHSGLVPLKPADVDFYMKIMRASLDRYQHPPAQDVKDLAENQRLLHLQALGTAKMTADMKAGNTQKAMSEVFQPTPDQKALMARSEELQMRLPAMLAQEAGMPRAQWDDLTKAVEDASGLNDEYNSTQWGSGDTDSTFKPSAEQLAKIQQATADRKRVAAANRQLVAPNAAEIKKIHELIQPIATQRMQAAAAAMAP
jgi:hypothetical protein